MNRSLILYDNSNSSRLNIYTLQCNEGNYNIPYQFTSSSSVYENGYLIYKITDSKLEGCNNFGLIITLPEIKGIGSIRYQSNFVYKLIEEFVIETIDNDSTVNTIIKKSGLELLFEFNRSGSKYSKIIGNNIDLCSFNTGYTADDIIFTSREIYFPLITIFDNQFINPHTCLRLFPKTKLQIKLKLTDFKNVMVYDKIYLKNSLKNITNIDLQPYISFTGYNTTGSEIKNRFLEELVLTQDNCTTNCNKKIYYTPDFSSITNVLWSIKVDNFNGKSFISYPNYPETEESFIKSYVDKILQDLLIVDFNNNFYAKRKFDNKKCKFVEIKPFDVVKHDVNNQCIINIKGIPEGMKLYYHKNILSFSRRNKNDEYNISNKFKYILGEYLEKEDRIYFIDVKHDISISDVSIPIEIWNAEENTSTGDLRSDKMKEMDVIVYDNFIFGMDFISKDLGIFTSTLKTNSNETIHDINSDRPNYEFYLNSNCVYPVTPINDESYPSIFIHRFNQHSILLSEPSRLIADNDKNFRRISICINWKHYPDTDPRSLFKQYMIIGMTIVKKVTYDNNIINVHIVDERK
ncbi:ORF MSV069 putative rifampicin resistance (RIF) protein, Heliothis armigera entomopoxvirus RIF homolog (vaccinia D13L) similar to GB:U44841 [Melanoplus sanguinipes entomopoxvirus]|uniref:62 kDa protein n=1 Tax=Melanoplus sanguinipes entomopoxvirus TaxID=83191 RepID=Q9YW23_MSEPV|nr:ORF MSV069 putative rifampicin resistance (RIF) protein, Heliothis armigera entomopoxvirus RIF homolog (vaccinia D13L) similar to GB:U44841 [Melanoplus sanguinipes entomopoxvirus]AAC97814.1 ORF MSV069 putative rifampicin resistance (RIF) protein, Heliothis armigera entomopoxvirus RIF homolog (vaccinia D13L) similar to GB:U44841 [Melanoplus sanguinipes entomopoxvirus 'O']